ncbi:MAG TPA: DUF4012 domain-containing protein [Patescibacteria group bacterium]|nr:DUF4012 domain-containing protein [Patescibacteria group bacterium]
MTVDEINIPQIEPDSVLIPKIEVDAGAPEAMEAREEVKNPTSAFLRVGVGIMAFILILLVAVGIPAFLTYQKGLVLYKSIKNLESSAKSQDLSQIKTQITSTSKALSDFKTSYILLSWTRIIPYFGGYVSDLGHAVNAAQAGMDAGQIVITTIEPYSDLLGLKGTNGQQAAPAADGAKTAQDRIDFIVKSLPSLLPQIDNISGKMKVMESETSQIKAERYPEEIKGKKIRSNIKLAQDLIDETSNLLVNGKPLIENAPYLLGMDSPRTYFVLFQNDKELRPTGGFMTAYAIMKVDKAKFNPTLSDDIYNLDAKYKPSIKAPDPIIKYIKGPYVLSQNLRLRDMNWSPDFTKSMEMVSPVLSQVGVKNIDGIIAVDTKVLDNLLSVIGPIGVPGFGNFSTAIDPQCNCSQVIHALEAYADVEGPIIWDPLTGKIIQRPANSENRKKIIGPLMNSILANAMGQPKEKLAALFSAVFNSVMEKDVLFYINDPKVQKAVTDFGIGGVIKDYDGDYLHINDANLGGRKSNLYSTEDVEQDIKIAGDGTVTKTLVITYKNPEKQDGWLNSVLPTWVRVYVPKGSTLVAMDGVETKADPYEDLGKTVFAGYFQLRPEGLAKVTIQYKLPFKVKGQYKLLIQKQPGANDYLYTVKVGRTQQEFYLKTDKEVKIGL